MRRILVCALVLASACGKSSSGDDGPTGPTGTITANVTHYDYTFDIASRVAHATVTATVVDPGNCLTLPFRAMDLDATTALYDGKPALSATADGANLTTCGTDGHVAGDTLTIDADMTVALATLGASQVGYSVTKDSEGNEFSYLVSWVNGCDQFGPCDNAPNVFATYHFTVTHDASLMVRCPGTITEDSATQTECDFEDDGGPTYSTFGIAAYPAWTQTDMGTWGGIHVTVYDRASTDIVSHIVSSYHDGFLQFMEGALGPYPFGSELRVLTAPTYWNGFEHPTNIVLADTLYTSQHTSPYADDLAHTLDHEMTHMWAGNQTTLAGTYDFAWKESMAEYMPFVYEDMTNPVVSARTANAWKNMAAANKYWPVPDDMPTLFDYYGDVYGAGPMVLFRQLEVMTSRAQVLAAIKSVLGTPHSLSIDQLVAALAQQTGLDLTAYSAEWIHGTGTPVWPTFDVTFTPGTTDPTTSSLVVHQSNQAAGVRGCKFHIGLYNDTTMSATEVVVDTYNNGPDQTIAVPTPTFTVTRTAVDPDHECLAFPTATSLIAPVRTNPWVAPR